MVIRSRGEEGGGGKDRLSSSFCEHGRSGSHAFQVPRLSDLPGRNGAVVQEGA